MASTAAPVVGRRTPSSHPEPSGSGSQRWTVLPAAREALEHYKQKDASKVVVRFKSIGSAAVMKNNLFKITAGNRFQAVIVFLRGQLGLKPEDPLYTYINAAFAPAPDDTVGNLFKNYGTEGHLIVNYSSTPAWS